MATYLIQVSYTSASMAALVAKPQDRSKVLGGAIKKLGGKLTGLWFSFGEHDVLAIAEMPDNIAMAALSMAVGAGGACSSVKTTPLLTVTEVIKALEKAGASGYAPVAR